MTGPPAPFFAAAERDTRRHRVEVERFEYVPAGEAWAFRRLLACLRAHRPLPSLLVIESAAGHHPAGDALSKEPAAARLMSGGSPTVTYPARPLGRAMTNGRGNGPVAAGLLRLAADRRAGVPVHGR